MKVTLYDKMKDTLNYNITNFKISTRLFFQPIINLYFLSKIINCVNSVKTNDNNDLFIEFKNNVITVNNNIITYSKGVNIRDTGIRISDNPNLATMSYINNDLDLTNLIEEDRKLILVNHPDYDDNEKHYVFNNAANIFDEITNKECKCSIKA